MLFKLALKNIIKKPFRALAIVLAIAIAVSMFFSILSFNDTVYDYIYAQRIADKGDTDIFITYTSDVDSERILDVEPLKKVEGVKDVIPSLDLFATYNDEYVRIRGFESGSLTRINEIHVLEGSIETLNSSPNRVAISENTAKNLGLKLGQKIELTLGNSKTSFYVGVIAKNDGYFITDELYTFIGTSKGGVSKLVMDAYSPTFYNQIFVDVKNGYSVDEVIKNIKAKEEYKNKSVSVSINIKDVEQNATSLYAPIAIAGGAVAFLGITFIYVLFVLSEKDRRQYASKLGIIGATRGQIFSVFIIENFILAFIGAVIGSGLAVGIYVGIIKLVLSSALAFSISAVKLFGAALIGLFAALICSLQPLVKAFKSSVKENLMQIDHDSYVKRLLSLLILPLFIGLLCVEVLVPEALGYVSIVNIIMLLVVLVVVSPYIMQLTALIIGHTNNAPVKIATNNLIREKRNSRTVALMTVGMIVSMVLFMAWDISTSVFTDYKKEIDDLIYIQNIKETVKLDEIRQVEGVDKAYTMVIDDGEFKYKDKQKAITIVGTKHATEIFDFEYLDTKESINAMLNSGGNILIMSKNFASLYNIRVGDVVTISMKTNDQVKDVPFKVGGLVNSMTFSGNFVFISEDVIKAFFDKPVNQVVIKTNDVGATVNRLKTTFAKNNYFVISTEELASWTDKTTSAIFDLVGTIAGVITVFIFVALLTSLVVSRSNSKNIRRALLSTGMSKNDLLGSEIFEHFIIAFTAYFLAYIMSPLITFCLINALRLFDLSFDFMYNAMVVGLVGLCMAVAYTLAPIYMNFKAGYKLKIRE